VAEWMFRVGFAHERLARRGIRLHFERIVAGKAVTTPRSTSMLQQLHHSTVVLIANVNRTSGIDGHSAGTPSGEAIPRNPQDSATSTPFELKPTCP
jgi:hypothetical protein